MLKELMETKWWKIRRKKLIDILRIKLKFKINKLISHGWIMSQLKSQISHGSISQTNLISQTSLMETFRRTRAICHLFKRLSIVSNQLQLIFQESLFRIRISSRMMIMKTPLVNSTTVLTIDWKQLRKKVDSIKSYHIMK